MKLIIIRHGDPDYSIDSLTETGWVEAEYLSERISRMNVKEFYVSPMGRAKDTASFTLKKMNRTATELEWLREFAPRISRPDKPDKASVIWDWLPQDWTADERFYDPHTWYDNEIMQAVHVKEEYEWVIKNFEEFLSSKGYVRDGHLYRVEQGNEDTYVFFCHFGLGTLLISHLIGVSPMVLWHGFCAAPTSVSIINTEERRKGIASFRVSHYGDTSHLYIKNQEPAFAARYCEIYENMDQKH